VIRASTCHGAYRGALTLGVEELAKRDLPATMFVAPARLGDSPFWWDTLADAGGGSISKSARRHALEELQGRQAAILEWATTDRRDRPLPAHLLPGSEEELRRAVARTRMTLASHGWSHSNLARLRPDDLEDELLRTLRWLRERSPVSRPWLAYPYGISSAAVERAAAAAGYQAAFRVDGGRLRKRHRNPYALPRLNVPRGLSAGGFRLRTAAPLP
jgi:peptidoglycan/xylan/chitin deacetylase (PgdA/CDA1 family)